MRKISANFHKFFMGKLIGVFQSFFSFGRRRDSKKEGEKENEKKKKPGKPGIMKRLGSAIKDTYIVKKLVKSAKFVGKSLDAAFVCTKCAFCQVFNYLFKILADLLKKAKCSLMRLLGKKPASCAKKSASPSSFIEMEISRQGSLVQEQAGSAYHKFHLAAHAMSLEDRAAALSHVERLEDGAEVGLQC